MRKLSIATRNMLVTSVNIILVGTVLIVACYFIQTLVLSQQLQSDSYRLVKAWDEDLKAEDIVASLTEHARDSELHLRLTGYLDSISHYNPNVGQAYVFGTELEDGNLTTFLAQPTAMLDVMESRGLALGGMLDQPAHIVEGIKEMLATEKTVVTPKYDDTVGVWVTALKPIFDEEGTIFAYFAVDIDASMIDRGQAILLFYGTLFLLVVLLTCLTVQYFINKATFKPLNQLVEAIDQVGKGNYNPVLEEGPDELGRINARFNKMMGHVREMLIAIGSASTQIAVSSEKLYESAENNKDNAESIANETDDVSINAKKQEQCTSDSVISLEGMAASIASIAESTASVAVTSMEAQLQSQQGDFSMKRIAQQMQEIHTAVETSAATLAELRTHSDQVDTILHVLNEITQQADALSYTVEREAPARVLIEQAKESLTRVIKEIAVIQEKAHFATGTIEEGAKRVNDGIDIVDGAGKIFGRIFESNAIVADQLQDVAAAAEELKEETITVTETMHTLAQVASSNADRAENITNKTNEQLASNLSVVESATDLKDIAYKLQKVLSDLDIK